ncbi:condensation domain-containing protein [Streptomyces sp. NBC_00846]|uniref:condensation domain-containing protein n=1 Tax=Streptomyces sp. NBC_00846 TaxID=2975849 RepID=UPI00386B1592|nr:condensation domain-containing protein [Streptomyces sp. NBC_00846]
MAADAPLTFGQLSTWRSIETFSADRLMEVNVPALWNISGLTEDGVERALRALTARHEALRTTFHTDSAGRPFQRVHDETPFPLTRVDLPRLDGAAAMRVLRDLYATPFPVVGDLGRHATLIRVAGRPAWLAVSMSHMVVDVWAVRALETELRALAEGAQPGPAPVPRELALLQHGEKWASRRRGADRYWQKVLDTALPHNLPLGPARGPDERRVQATFSSHVLAALVAESSRTHKVSPQSLLTALTALALAGHLDHDRVTLSVMCANRFDPAWLPLVSTMNQLVPLTLAVDRDTPVSAFVKRAHLTALLAYRHGCYDVDSAARLGAEAAVGDDTLFRHDCWFNYVTSPAPPEDPGTAPLATGDAPVPDAVLEWSSPPRHAGHPFYLRVNSDGARYMEMTMRVDPDLISPQAVSRLLRTVVVGVRRLLVEPDTTLGALTDGVAGERLGPALFPAAPDPCPPAGHDVRDLVALPR